MFMRGVYGVGGFNRAPALEPKLGAFFWVTPISEVGRRRASNRSYGEQLFGHLEAAYDARGDARTLRAIGICEYVQPRGRRLLRIIFGNGPYVEGWAVYATEVMVDSGLPKRFARATT